jgi:hypothetical protein
MKKSKFTEQQIALALQQFQSGTADVVDFERTVSSVAQNHVSISPATEITRLPPLLMFAPEFCGIFASG